MGADLPSDSIATATKMTGARAVALSVTFPPDDPELGDELRRLRHLLPVEVALIVGGQAAPHYREVLDEIDALSLPDAPALRSALDLVLASDRNGNDRA
jgi:hypothetical protein